MNLTWRSAFGGKLLVLENDSGWHLPSTTIVLNSETNKWTVNCGHWHIVSKESDLVAVQKHAIAILNIYLRGTVAAMPKF